MTLFRHPLVFVLAALYAACLLTSAGVSGMSPTWTPAACGTASGKECHHHQQQQQQTSSIFGVAKLLPSSAVLSLRGGEVLEGKTQQEVEGILVKAGAEGKIVIIDFTASWCGPCKMIAPIFKELSDHFEKAVFVKVDVDENPDTAAKYEVSAMPTFVIIKEGEIVERVMGANPNALKGSIESHH